MFFSINTQILEVVAENLGFVTDVVEKTLGFGAGFGYRINTVQMWWLLVASSHRGC